MPRHPALLPIVGALLMLAATGAAAVPSPANSTLPSCMALCPMGDLPFTVVVRDLANNPIAGSGVVLDFSSCPAAFLCAPLPSDSYLTDPAARTLRGFTNAAGSVTIPARVGGTGPAGSVRVFADGVLLRGYALASPDQDGNGVAVSVIGSDVPLFTTKFGTSDPTADFDCDGHVDIVDQQIFGFHLSHSCDGFVDAARRGTWGQVKSFYH